MEEDHSADVLAAIETVLQGLAVQDTDAVSEVITRAGAEGWLGRLILNWACAIASTRAGVDAVQATTTAQDGARWEPYLVSLVDAAHQGVHSAAEATDALQRDLANTDIWYLAWNLAYGMYDLAATVGGMGAWWELIGLHERFASTPEQENLAPPAAAIIAAIANGRLSEARTYLEHAVVYLDPGAGNLLQLWLYMIGRLMRGPMGASTALLLGPDGTPEGVVQLDADGDAGDGELKTARLLNHLVAAVTADDEQRVQRVCNNIAALDLGERMLMVYQVAVTLGYHVAQFRTAVFPRTSQT